MLNLSVLKDNLSVCRLSPDYAIPGWATAWELFSITKTLDELSIVCFEKYVPTWIKSEKWFKALKIEWPLDFSLTWILSSIANPLAVAEISIFAISTYDTDYILVREIDFNKAINILKWFCNILEN